MSHKILRFHIHLISLTILLFVGLTVGCSAQTEEQALQSLRQMTREGKLPSEEFVAAIERRFSGKRTGALAKLLRAHIRFENKDFAGAAAILNTDEFRQKTKVADHALWLRGRSLQEAGNHAEAMSVFSTLISDFPDSIRTRDAKLLWAESALQTGKAGEVPPLLAELADGNDLQALMLTAKAYDAQNSRQEASRYYYWAYGFALGTKIGDEAKARIIALGSTVGSPDVFPHAGIYPGAEKDALRHADYLFNIKNYQRAASVYDEILREFPTVVTAGIQLRRLTALANVRRMVDARAAFNSLPVSAKEREEAYYHLAIGYAKARLWSDARQAAEEMRQKFPAGKWTPKAWVDAGYAARDARNKGEESYFLRTALSAYPNAIEIAGAQFELAWIEHENNNFSLSSQMLVEHLARYVDKDTTNRGKAGYWAARDSERAGKTAEACALYDGVIHRYSANWYGYLALNRLTSLKNQGKCGSNAPVSPTVTKAIANLKTITVAAETSTEKELARADKSEDLSVVGLFDWAIDELQEAKKTAQNSPKINLALAQHYRLKGDNVNALLALAKSYPDYSQMFPEEMGREEWDIFYPLAHWDQITNWARHRDLDKYQVAGLIRQESVFNSRAKSPANAYGLMQLILPTARSTARKYGSAATISIESLFQPALNIELGTAYMRDQFDKFGRIEYVAVAYNAGPNRVPQWRATLPVEIDDFVEAIPFKETKGYVQGIIRNSAQYRRLYDDTGTFKPNVGTKPLRGLIDTMSRERLAAELPEIVVDNEAGEE